MRGPSFIIFIFCSFGFTHCSIDYQIMLEKTAKEINEFTEALRLSEEQLAKVNETQIMVRDFVEKVAQFVELQKIVLQPSCVARKFSRQSLSQYEHSTADYLYQCEKLINRTDELSRIIGCETEAKDYICYRIHVTGPLPEPDKDGLDCYMVDNPFHDIFKEQLPDLIVRSCVHASIHVISFTIICVFLIVICFQCRNARRLKREQPEDIDIDSVKYNRSNFWD
ncbi:uncharacterized protein LOC107370656 [Tetranychus urticae]|uniref:uncharacterized protein LOC107370656 n=1 Tax=Tetranychus urticae TaxID=32264 RepID=UPI00077BC59B|nr:uncharacterized protein LOC107370656 [Tetranychus urticae]